MLHSLPPALLPLANALSPLLLFQNEAATDGEGGAPPKGLFDSFLFPAIAIFAIFYFVLIRPEKKKQQERQNLLESLKKGTKVMTTSGLYGTIAQVKDDVVTLQVADGVRLRFNKAAIQDVMDGKSKDGAKDGAKDAGKDSGKGDDAKASKEDAEEGAERETTGAASS